MIITIISMIIIITIIIIVIMIIITNLSHNEKSRRKCGFLHDVLCTPGEIFKLCIFWIWPSVSIIVKLNCQPPFTIIDYQLEIIIERLSSFQCFRSSDLLSNEVFSSYFCNKLWSYITSTSCWTPSLISLLPAGTLMHKLFPCQWLTWLVHSPSPLCPLWRSKKPCSSPVHS